MPLIEWLHFVPSNLLPLAVLGPLHLKCVTATHKSGFVSSQVTHYHSLKWLSIISGVPLLHMGLPSIVPGFPLSLTRVIPHHTK